MYERGSRVGESGTAVFEDPAEMSVMDRRFAKRRRYTGVLSSALRERDESELWRALFAESFINAKL